MIPQSLAILLTKHCNFICDHCSVCAGPNKREETMSETLMKTAIEQAYYIPSIKVVAFTGGEVTLYFEQLKRGIKYAHEKGFTTRIVSNVWWAKTYEDAYAFLKELVSCGLDEINVSYDDFHVPYLAQFGGEQNVINAVRAAIDLGRTIVIGIVLQPGAKIRSAYLRQVFSDVGITGCINYVEDYVSPLGRAREKIPRNLWIVNTEKQGTGCGEAGKTVVVLPDGKVAFCCGHTVFTQAQDCFVVDNLVTGVSIAEIIKRIQKNVLSWMLYIEGPEWILTRLNVTKSFNNKCEACFYLCTVHKNKLRALASKKEEIFAHITSRKNDPAVIELVQNTREVANENGIPT